MIAWSFSQMNNFRTCAKRWYHYNVNKDVKEPEGEAMKWGFQVHAAMAAAIDDSTPLPETMPYQHWIDWVKSTEGCDVRTEQKLAITEQFEPCEFFDRKKKVWFRTVLDVVKINGQVARIIDWKTGKKPDNPVKRAEAEQQLWLSATAVFARYPDVVMVRTNLVYLQEDDSPKELAHRDIWRKDLPTLWTQVTPTLSAMQFAMDTNSFPPNPSGLCKRHCAVAQCPYYGKGSR